jgi:hypothetical protein
VNAVHASDSPIPAGQSSAHTRKTPPLFQTALMAQEFRKADVAEFNQMDLFDL